MDLNGHLSLHIRSGTFVGKSCTPVRTGVFLVEWDAGYVLIFLEQVVCLGKEA